MGSIWLWILDFEHLCHLQKFLIISSAMGSNPDLGILALMTMVLNDHHHFAHSRLLNGWHVGFVGNAMRVGEPTHDWAQSSVFVYKHCSQTRYIP